MFLLTNERNYAQVDKQHGSYLWKIISGYARRYSDRRVTFEVNANRPLFVRKYERQSIPGQFANK